MSQYGYIDEKAWAVAATIVVLVLVALFVSVFLLGRCSAGYTVKVQSPVVTEKQHP